MQALKNHTLLLVFTLLTVFAANAQSDHTKPVNTVIANYLALKDALITGDGALASAKAKTLLTSIDEVPKNGLNASDAALLPKLAFDSRHISEVNKIAHQREHFTSLSNNLYTLLKKLKVNNKVLYRQYCTITKAYFLSDTEKGKDPYMGMANCSKMTDVLAADKK
jgi:hypothetical protein